MKRRSACRCLTVDVAGKEVVVHDFEHAGLAVACRLHDSDAAAAEAPTDSRPMTLACSQAPVGSHARQQRATGDDGGCCRAQQAQESRLPELRRGCGDAPGDADASGTTQLRHAQARQHRGEHLQRQLKGYHGCHSARTGARGSAGFSVSVHPGAHTRSLPHALRVGSSATWRLCSWGRLAALRARRRARLRRSAGLVSSPRRCAQAAAPLSSCAPGKVSVPELPRASGGRSGRRAARPASPSHASLLGRSASAPRGRQPRVGRPGPRHTVAASPHTPLGTCEAACRL